MIVSYRKFVQPGDWVILGKGPTFADWMAESREFRTRFQTLGLNHVIQKCPCDIAHFTDWEAFRASREAVLSQARALVMPWVPHAKFRPGPLTLQERMAEDFYLEWFEHEGRLGSYNSSQARKVNTTLPNAHVRYFSAVAAVALLAGAGIKKIYTAGVDGGDRYAPGFDVGDKLANGRLTYDAQFKEMDRLAAKYKLTIEPLFSSRS